MVPRKPVVQSFQISRMKQKFRCACNSTFGFSILSHFQCLSHSQSHASSARGPARASCQKHLPSHQNMPTSVWARYSGKNWQHFLAILGDFEVLTRTPRQQFGCVPGHFVILKGNNPTYQQNHTKPTTPQSIDDSSLPWHAMAMARVKYGMAMPTLLASFLGEDRGSVISTWSRLLGFPNRNGPTALTDIKSIQSILRVHCTRWLNLGRLFFIVNSYLKKKLHKEGLEEGSSLSDFQSGMSELSTTTSSNMPSAPKPYCPTWARALASLHVST